MNTPNIVPINKPPTAPVPIALLPRAPIPEENTSGVNPIMNAKDVIRMGLRRARAPSNAAFIRVYPARRL